MRKSELKELFSRIPALELLLEDLYFHEMSRDKNVERASRTRLPWNVNCVLHEEPDHQPHEPEPHYAGLDPDETPSCTICEHSVDIVWVHDFEKNGAKSAVED